MRSVLPFVVAVAYLAVGLFAGPYPFFLLAAWSACCIPIIRCADEMGSTTIMMYVGAKTGESPKTALRQAGWVLLLLPGIVGIVAHAFGN